MTQSNDNTTNWLLRDLRALMFLLRRRDISPGEKVVLLTTALLLKGDEGVLPASMIAAGSGFRDRQTDNHLHDLREHKLLQMDGQSTEMQVIDPVTRKELTVRMRTFSRYRISKNCPILRGEGDIGKDEDRIRRATVTQRIAPPVTQRIAPPVTQRIAPQDNNNTVTQYIAPQENKGLTEYINLNPTPDVRPIITEKDLPIGMDPNWARLACLRLLRGMAAQAWLSSPAHPASST